MSSGEKFITENYEQLMINCLQVKVWSFFFSLIYLIFLWCTGCITGGIVNT